MLAAADAELEKLRKESRTAKKRLSMRFGSDIPVHDRGRCFPSSSSLLLSSLEWSDTKVYEP